MTVNELEFSMTIVINHYESGKPSLGQAAKMVGISKRTFIELMGKFGGSIFSDSIKDLENDIVNA